MDVIPEPWSWVLDEAASRVALRDRSVTSVAGVGSPRLVLPQDCHVRWSAQRGEAPMAGFPFLDWDRTSRCMYHLPASHVTADGDRDVALTWSSGNHAGHLTQLGLTMRPKDAAAGSTGVVLEQCIQWTIHAFLELAQSEECAATDSKAGGLLRRSWAHACQVWLQALTDEPRMELIIKLASDARLRDALESVAAHPRRILLRVREETPIGRITEFDAACIRDYVRRPGRTAFEKAGAAQRLMAVQRKASFDTLENRLTCWTLDELHRRSRQWRHRHLGSRAGAGARARLVAGLGRLTLALRRSEDLSDIATASLVHPVMANYPLQMEPRYHTINGAYKELLRYRRIQDEAWTWRRPLWSDTVRQLLACSLVQKLGEPVAESAPYYRTEAERGRWLAAPSGPGPFQTARGPMYIMDAHDIEQMGPRWYESFPAVWAAHIGMLGPDSILWWPERNAVVVVWGHLWCGSGSAIRGHVEAAAQALQRFADALLVVHRQRIQIAGMLVSTDRDAADVDCIPSSGAQRRVVGLTIPMCIDPSNQQQFERMSENLEVGIQLAIEEACQ